MKGGSSAPGGWWVRPLRVHPFGEVRPGRRFLPAERACPAGGCAAGSVLADRFELQLVLQRGVGLDDQRGGGRRVGAHLALAAAERLQEGAQVLSAGVGLVFAHHQHQLVVGRDARLVDRDHGRRAVRELELDGLVVPVPPERRVDLSRQHRRHQVEADVDFLGRPRAEVGGVQGRRQHRRLVGDPGGARRSCPCRSATLVTWAAGSAMIEVSGRCTSAPIETSAQALVACQQQLGLIGDRHVDLAGGEQLQRFVGLRRAPAVSRRGPRRGTRRARAPRRGRRGRRWGTSRASR